MTNSWVDKYEADLLAAMTHISAVHPLGFRDNINKSGLRSAERVRIAQRFKDAMQSELHHYFGLTHFVRSFGDPHIFYLSSSVKLTLEWPLFSVRLINNSITIASSRLSYIKVGVQVTHVDGKPVNTVLRDDIYPFYCPSNTAILNQSVVQRLFLYDGNPFIKRPSNINLSDRTASISISELWTPVQMSNSYTQEPTINTTDSNVVIIRIPSFSSSILTRTVLDDFLREIDSNFDRICGASSVVFDLRGNGGGSTFAAYQIVDSVLWTVDTRTREPRTSRVAAWRASKPVLRHVKRWLNSSSVIDDDIQRLNERLFSELSESIRRHRDIYVQAFSRASLHGNVRTSCLPPRRQNIFAVIDEHCYSATCDIVRFLQRNYGCVILGSGTNAEPPYTEVISTPLPSKTGVVGSPAKMRLDRPFWRQRAILPDVTVPGDVVDQNGFREWLTRVVTNYPSYGQYSE